MPQFANVMAGVIDAFTSVPAIIAYIVLILVLIAVLAIAVMMSGSGNANNGTASTVIMQAAPEKEDTPAEEENAERFCMLSDIDRKKNSYGHTTYDRNTLKPNSEAAL